MKEKSFLDVVRDQLVRPFALLMTPGEIEQHSESKRKRVCRTIALCVSFFLPSAVTLVFIPFDALYGGGWDWDRSFLYVPAILVSYTGVLLSLISYSEHTRQRRFVFFIFCLIVIPFTVPMTVFIIVGIWLALNINQTPWW